MSERRDAMHRATLASTRERGKRLRLLRRGRRLLLLERTPAGQYNFVVRRRGREEQRGVARPSVALGAPRLCGEVRLHARVVADALDAAYASRCVAEAGARP